MYRVPRISALTIGFVDISVVFSWITNSDLKLAAFWPETKSYEFSSFWKTKLQMYFCRYICSSCGSMLYIFYMYPRFTRFARGSAHPEMIRARNAVMLHLGIGLKSLINSRLTWRGWSRSHPGSPAGLITVSAGELAGVVRQFLLLIAQRRGAVRCPSVWPSCNYLRNVMVCSFLTISKAF